RPGVQGSIAPESASAPAAVAICVDQSASMAYVVEGQSRVERARAMASRLTAEIARSAPGSGFWVTTTGASGPPTWINDTAAVSHALEGIVPLADDRPLGAAVDVALKRLTESRLTRRELYVFTDNMQRAWARIPRPVTANTAAISVHVVDVGANENR